MAELRFPILMEPEWAHLDCPRSVPWAKVQPHAAQALRNHSQTLETLASRGGLSPAELWMVMHGKAWFGHDDTHPEPQTVVAFVRGLQND